jgi:citrate lyase subunit beta / citryl-CoA lyase
VTRPGATPRTWLFVPGDRPGRFSKAVASGAGAIICDLEDAVAAEHKPSAREHVAQWLAQGGTGWVRINGLGTSWHDDDVAALTDQPGLRGLVVPKAEAPIELRALGQRLGDRGMIALIETALGLHRVHEISGCDAVDRLAFGAIDFASDIGAGETDESLLLARSTLVMASRLAAKPAPIDGVTVSFDDPTLVAAAATYSRRLGFGAKLCIHPAQLAPVEAAFRPSADELRWAADIVAAAERSGSGASALHGHMIDKPLLDRARRVLTDDSADRDQPGSDGPAG